MNCGFKMTSSEGSRTSNSSRLSQFGIYKSIDARTEEFLRLSRRRQLRQGCACAALSTAITVTIVVTGLLVYEYTTTLSMQSRQEPGRSNWYEFLNTSTAFNPRYIKTKIDIDPTIIKLFPLLLKALKFNENQEKILKDYKIKKVKYPRTSKQTLDNLIVKRLLPTTKRTTPSIYVKYNYPVVKPLNNKQNLEHFRKKKHSKNQERVLNYFNKMIDGSKKPTTPPEEENTNSQLFNYHMAYVNKRNSERIRQGQGPTTPPQKEKTKSQLFNYHMAYINKLNSKIVEQSKKYRLLNTTQKYELTKKNILTIEETKINDTLFMFESSTARNTLRKPAFDSYLNFTNKRQVLKYIKTGDHNCSCSVNLLELLNQLMLKIQNLTLEVMTYEKRYHNNATTLENIKITTALPTMTTVLSTLFSAKKFLTTKFTNAEFLTEPTRTIKYTSESTTISRKTISATPLLLQELLKSDNPLHCDRKMHRISLREPTDDIKINEVRITHTHNIKTTTDRNAVKQTNSFSEKSSTASQPRKSLQYYDSKPLESTSKLNKNTVQVSNHFKGDVESYVGSEHERDVENQNMETKSLKVVGILNSEASEGSNRNKIKEEEPKTERIINLKSFLYKVDEKVSTSPVNKINKNNIDEVLKKYTEIDGLITQTQNISQTSEFEQNQKRNYNSTALDYDYDIDIDAIDKEQTLVSEPGSNKENYDKYDTVNEIPTNIQLNDLISMMPIIPSYSELHSSVSKQDTPDYDNALGALYYF